ncbi:MAG: hypothetical protein LUH10_14245 [Tannerellaceae bacterium]|nr:hypothetical protein [Tannerellaceae bacterium]
MKTRKADYRKPVNLSTPGVYLYTLGISLICWVTGYLFSVGYPETGDIGDTPLWIALCEILPGKIVTYAAGLLLMVGGALLIQRTNYVLVLVREKTFFPFVLYILLISTNPDFFPLKSTSLGIFCLILALYILFRSYHNPLSQENSFMTAFLIGIGSLLWIHMLWFLPLFWYGMYSMKCWNLKTFFASLIGVITVYWFLFGWCILWGDLSVLTLPFATLGKVRLLMLSEIEPLGWVTLLWVAVMTIVSSIYILTRKHEESLRARQYLGFLIVFAVFSFLLFFLYEQSSEEFLVAACLPSSILLAHFFAINKGRRIFWLYLFFVTIVGILILVRLWGNI